MSHVIKLLCTYGGPTEHDGRFVVDYAPAAMDEHGALEGGRIVTSDKLSEARRFPNAAEAFEYYRAANGTRPDGRMNRPLTAWHALISPEEEFQ